MQEKNNKGTSGSAESFINDDMSFYSLGNGEKNIKTGSSFWKETMMSMMGRINYMFDSKYMVTLHRSSRRRICIRTQQQVCVLPLGRPRMAYRQ